MSSTKRRLDPRNTTGYTGVYKKRQRFRAQIKIDRKTIRLGIYDTPKEAGLAYDRAVVQHNLAPSRLNFPNGLPLDDKDYDALMNPTKKRRLRPSNTSGYNGVGKTVRQGFKAKITVDGSMKYLGIYSTPEEAAFAYDRAVVKYKLASSKLNYPNGVDYKGMHPKMNLKKKRRRLDPRNTTGYTGVIKRRKRFQAQIKINRKEKYLGTYDTPKEAALAYDRAVVQHKLSYSKLNFPHDWPSSDEDESDGDEGVESLKPSSPAQPLFHRESMLDQLVAEEQNKRQMGEQEEYVEVEVGSADIQFV